MSVYLPPKLKKTKSMTFTEIALRIFGESIKSYHETDYVDSVMPNPYKSDSIEYDLFKKNWIDTVQWHLEDLIRAPEINADVALTLKRRIDKSNQERTDLVEKIDDFFLKLFSVVKVSTDAVLNTESPAWALDRLSILVLKIYHMNVEVNRSEVSLDHVEKCKQKLGILLEQQDDLTKSINQLLEDIEKGKRYMKVYRQMKMYNDPSLNPSLYKNI